MPHILRHYIYTCAISAIIILKQRNTRLTSYTSRYVKQTQQETTQNLSTTHPLGDSSSSKSLASSAWRKSVEIVQRQPTCKYYVSLVHTPNVHGIKQLTLGIVILQREKNRKNSFQEYDVLGAPTTDYTFPLNRNHVAELA